MLNLKAEHELNGVFGKCLDLIKLLILDVFILNHEAAAAGKNFVKGKVVKNIVFIETAGRHEFDSAIRSGHCLEHG